MKSLSVVEKILRLHRLDGSVSWRALAFFRYVKEGVNYTSDELEGIKAELLKENLIEFVDEKHDVTILTAKGRRLAQIASNPLKKFVHRFLYGKCILMPPEDVETEIT